jgi:carboxymethylenebutenolidase
MSIRFEQMFKMALEGRMFETLTAADGHAFDCWTAQPEERAWGGLVILQEIFGVTDQLKGVADRYAAEGLVVAIPALFDRQKRQTVFGFDRGAGGRDLMLAAKLEETMRDVGAAVDAMKSRGLPIAVLGFCWGGGLAIRAAQVLDISCAVAFYGTRLPQYLDRPLRAPVLGHFGTKDDHVPPEMLDAARAALPEMEVHLYKVGHAFANDARPSHVPDAAELAHSRTLGFLRAHMAQGR